MNNILQLDNRGLIRVCPHCGKRNRLLYERLGNTFHCGNCQTELSPPSEPVEVPRDMEFDALTAGSALPVLTDFWAPWCGPCKMVAPELEKAAAQGGGQWVVAKVNTEELPGLGARFQVRAIPTVVLFKSGREIARQAGAMGASAIVQFIRRAL